MARVVNIVAIFLAIAVALLAGCSSEDSAVPVSLGNVVRGEKHIPDRPERGAVRIAVAAMVTPRETLDVYGELLDYIGEKLGRPVELVQRKTYAEVNDLLRQRLIEAAFVCTQAYVEGNRDFGLELVAAPVVGGQAAYSAYIIVRKDSGVRHVGDLRGKSFAFSDPMSNTGKLVPTYVVAKMGATPDSFFSRYVFTYAHTGSIRAVAQGLVDGASVDSLVWDFANATDTRDTSRTRIIYQSRKFGSPPIVVHPNLSRELKDRLKVVLTGMHEDEQGRTIISKARIDRFDTIPDSAYDSVREMLAYLGAGRGP